MPKFEIEVTAVVAQTMTLTADSLESAEQLAIDLFKKQISDHQSDASYGTNAQHSAFDVYDFDIYDSQEVE